MKVDIIMPTHNPGTFIIEALQSCMIQSHKDIRITVVDDCSTTDLSYLKKKFPKVNWIQTPENLGPAGARNYGISKTSGELISFLDDDDVMDMHKVTLAVREFERNSRLGMTCGNYRILVNGKLRAPFYKKAPHIDHRLLMRQNFVASGSVTIRRTVFDDVGGFNPKYWIAEDYDLWLRVAEKHPIKYLHRVLYYYRIIPGGKSLTQRADIQAKHIENISEIRTASLKRIKKK
jgi:glycosyltransferase involved in cell wall biosynthesis